MPNLYDFKTKNVEQESLVITNKNIDTKILQDIARRPPNNFTFKQIRAFSSDWVKMDIAPKQYLGEIDETNLTEQYAAFKIELPIKSTNMMPFIDADILVRSPQAFDEGINYTKLVSKSIHFEIEEKKALGLLTKIIIIGSIHLEFEVITADYMMYNYDAMLLINTINPT